MTEIDPVDIIDNEREQRYEVEIDGHLAYLTYELRGDRLTILHTDVPPELSGRGIGGRLVREALERAHREGLQVRIFCPFARQYAQQHPEYRDLLV